jgi:TolA-binding protein
MPLPLILGGAALAAALYGAKKGVDGYQSHAEANELIDRAKARYSSYKSDFDAREKRTQEALVRLGQLELGIGKSFDEFARLADELLQRLNKNRQDKLKIQLPQHKLAKVESYSFTAVGVLGSAAGAGAAGAAAGFAVYGGVMTFAAASTGTAISALSGAAATNATLAAIGGGALSAGGLGMAGGTAILGAAVAAPVLAIAGWAYANHGEEALSNARKASNEVDAAVDKLLKAGRSLERTERYVKQIEQALHSINTTFKTYFDKLKQVNRRVEELRGMNLNVEYELQKISDDIMLAVQNGYAIAAIMTDIMTTPIFKVRTRNGEVVKDAKGIPQMVKDDDGSLTLNEADLDAVLAAANGEHQKYR